MNTIVNKISILAVSLIVSVAIGVAFTNQKALATKATGTTIYDYYSQTDSSLAASIPQTTNWILTDANAGTQKFTFNVGSNARVSSVNTVWLGGTSGAALTGSNADQFVFGNPSLKALATTTNLTTNSKLYGFRMDADINLTNYKDVTVTIGWASGGDSSSYTGFIAKSLGGSTESWSLLTGVKQAVVASTAGSLSYTDTANTVLQGRSTARFAIIIGGSNTRQVLKNIYLTVTANLRTTLDSINNPLFNHVGHYTAGGTMNFHDFYFTANYLYRLSGSTATVYGDASGVTLSLDNYVHILVNGGAMPAAGTYTLYYKYYDPTIDPSGLNPKTNTLTLVIDPEVLTQTGIYMVDAVNYVTNPLHKYDLYQPQISVYALFNSESTPRVDETPLGSSLYTTSLASGTMLTANTSNIATSSTFTSTLTVSVATRTSTGISLAGQKTSFYLGEAFSLGSLVVTGTWTAGQNTTPEFASSQTDGKYTVSKTIGEAVNTEGDQTITVSYYVNGANVTTTYTISVTLQTMTFFTHTFDGPIAPATTGEWGVTASPVYGVITNRSTTLTSSVTDGTSMDWILNTTSTDPTDNNTAFGMDDDAGACIRFGTETIDTTYGPTTITMETANVATSSVNGSVYNGISRITIDAETGVSGILTATVAGISPTSYAINYGTPVSESSVPTIAGTYNFYTFYFPYTIIGKINIHYINGSTPGHLDLNAMAIIGYNLPVADQTSVFGNMLNSVSSCYATAYTNNLPTYNYLSGTGAVAGLTSVILTNHNSISASALWSILVTRYSAPGASPSTPDTLSTNNQQLTIVLISVLGITAMGAYFFYNKKKSEQQ